MDAFALDALDSVDRGIVEHHLRWCETCRVEAARSERVVEFMHYTVEPGPAPSPDIKASLMTRIATIDQEESIPPARDRDVSAALQESGPAIAATPWWRHPSIVLVAPLVLALVVIGAWANALRSDLDERTIELESQVQLNNALANGGQVQLYSVEQSCPTCQGSGQLGVSESNGMGMVVGWNFDPTKQHDVWGVNSRGEKKKVCQLQVDDTGAVMQMFNFPAATSTFTDVFITDEHGTLTYISHLANASQGTPPDTSDTTPVS
jgi:hypothetical protein